MIFSYLILVSMVAITFFKSSWREPKIEPKSQPNYFISKEFVKKKHMHPTFEEGRKKNRERNTQEAEKKQKLYYQYNYTLVNVKGKKKQKKKKGSSNNEEYRINQIRKSGIIGS